MAATRASWNRLPTSSGLPGGCGFSGGAGPAWLIEDGADGLLAPVDDPALLAEAITRLAFDRELAPRLVAAGRRRFEADFTEAAVVARFLDLFERVRR